MINLLPPAIKKELQLEKKKKIAITLGIIILIPLISFILMLVSIRFYILSEVNAQKTILEDVRKKYETPDFLAFTKTIQENNKVLSQLKSFYKNEVYISNVLKIISDLGYPNGLYITNLALTRDQNQKIKVAISGFSKSREDLLVFQKKIEENKEIKNSYFSPESWIDSENIKFGVTFEIST